MITRNLIFSGAMLGVSAFFSPSYATPPMFPPNVVGFADIATLDTNADGKVSHSEWTTARTTEFAAIDTNNSGDLTLTELDAYTNQQHSKLFNLDSDGNGQLSLTEFVGSKTGELVNFVTEVFHLADRDANDSLNTTEIASLSPSFSDVIHHFAMLDRDFNLVISQDEFTNLPRKPMHGKFGDKAHVARH